MESIQKMEVKKEKSTNEIIQFFNRKKIYNVMRLTLSMILNGRKTRFKLYPSGGSYTDGDELVVGLLEGMNKMSYEELYISILALLGHEAQHVLSSNFKEFIRYNEEETRKLVALGFSKAFASKTVHYIGNCIEDGRIENILSNKLPGFIPKLQFLNIFIWESGGVEDENSSEHDALFSGLLSLSKLGIYPKGYKKFKGSDADKELKKIEPLIKKGIKARTCKAGLDVAREIITIITPFLKKVYDEVIKEQEMFQDFLDSLGDLFSDALKDAKEEEYNDRSSHTSHIILKRKDDSEEDDSEETSSGSGEKGEDEDKESGGKGGLSENEPDDSEDESDEDSMSNNPSEASEDEGENTDSDSEDNNQLNDESLKGDLSSESKDSPKDLKDKKENDKNDNSNKNENESKSYELSEGADADCSGDITREEDVLEKFNDLIKELSNEVEDALHEDKEIEEPTDSLVQLPSSTDFLAKNSATFKEYPNDFPLEHTLPTELSLPVRRFKKEIEKIFKNKSTMNIDGQKRGILNPDDLYKIGLNNYNIFSIEGNKSHSDYAVYILQDGSGSMYGEPEKCSAYALSIIEEGLRKVVPYKLVTFRAGGGDIMHHVIKNWNDKSSKNYSYNFYLYNRAGWANDDGVSIRVATMELMKRPEKDKILIILSDGLPSSIDDTKLAIKEARKQGVHLVGIMFGNDAFRKNHYPIYKEMYQKNIIATSPGGIPDKLTKVLKTILVR